MYLRTYIIVIRQKYFCEEFISLSLIQNKIFNDSVISFVK